MIDVEDGSTGTSTGGEIGQTVLVSKSLLWDPFVGRADIDSHLLGPDDPLDIRIAHHAQYSNAFGT
ncbi:hypothetical protein [Natrialba swarupiae]|uniref:Uncharacterized protein n=1 Tax=Natrialba swarupiae TaxID=2448032 RepID=A0A5D5AQD5_9EURY|nr:hypothetical protein [Natrialba swarupiae]TYT61251.1 hypothetical protein FYC77_14445 [Natrialba swarupiae]